MKVDERSEKNIATLLPEVQPLARKLIETAKEQGINAKIIGGTRTYAEQNALYAQGRTKPGQIVTKAKGGYSWHNHGMAFDIGIFSENGKEYYGESESYAVCGQIGEALGLEWGGEWDFVDEPHFQFNPLGLTLSEARKRTENGESLFV
jgi:peptidoglycan L-alanyl-D-glutamate endopeptidase CwlK